MSQSEILEKLTNAVVAGDPEACKKLANDALSAGIDPYVAIMEGCSKGMEILSKMYDKGEAFVPDILVAADAMNEAIAILKPHMKVEKATAKGKIVLGVCEGDIHDIGKNIVKILMDAAGYEIIDLGASVPTKKFVETVREQKPDIVGISALMTFTMFGMPEIIEALKDSQLRDTVKVIVGGGPISASFAEKIGADGFGANGPEAVRLVGTLLSERGVKK
ncbi:MAG: corrinoid protein [Candidatus Methanomethylicus sp.]|nr:corrinoid protein [Candidatus Methanomethylicus sp.]